MRRMEPPESKVLDNYSETRRFRTFPKIPENAHKVYRTEKYESINPYEKFLNGKGLNFTESSNFSCICDCGAEQLISCYRDLDVDMIPEHFSKLCRHCEHHVSTRFFDEGKRRNIWLPYFLIDYMEENDMFPEDERSKWIVYFITDGQFVKIGVTNKLKERIAGIQTGNPRTTKPLFLIHAKDSESSYKIETKLHSLYSEYRMSGEWYNILDKLNVETWKSRLELL